MNDKYKEVFVNRINLFDSLKQVNNAKDLAAIYVINTYLMEIRKTLKNLENGEIVVDVNCGEYHISFEEIFDDLVYKKKI